MASSFYIFEIDTNALGTLGPAHEVAIPVQQMDSPNWPNILRIKNGQPAIVNQLDVDNRWPPATIGEITALMDKGILRAFSHSPPAAPVAMTADQVRALI
jgi:hypothetical protein